MNYIETLQRQIDAMAKGFVQSLPALAIAVFILFVTWGVARFAVRLVSRVTVHTRIREDLKRLLQTLVRLAVWIVGFMIAMTIAIPSLTPASLFAGLGVGALAIGFAFQDIFENFLAGVLIMLREKMHIGDTIESDAISGKVENITLRETHIRQFSGELTIVPNSMLFKNPVKILTDTAFRRNQVVVGVSYDCDLEKTREVIRDAVKQVASVDLTTHSVDVFAQEFNASSIDFLVLWWSDTVVTDLRETKNNVVIAIKRALDDAGIEIPYPYVTNTFKEALPLAKSVTPAKAA